MAKLARDVMTPDPACCTASTSVDEVAKLMVQNDCGEMAGRTVEIVRDLGMEEDTIVSSFDHVMLAEVRRLAPRIATGVLTSDRLYRVREYLEALDADAYHPADHVDRATVKELTGAGLLVNVWTINTRPRMRALIDAGVTGIFTDYPNRLAEVASEAGRCVTLRPRLRRRRSG